MMLPEPVRKAAILLASLDPASADGLLRQMEPGQAAQLRAAASALEGIDEEEQQRVISEFVGRRPRSAELVPPGIELVDSLRVQLQAPSDVPGSPAAGLNPPPRGGRGGSTGWKPDSAPPFGFLDEVGVEYLSGAIAEEHPQTIALVVSHLDPHRAAEVLSALPAPTQVNVVRRMLDLGEPDPEILREVELAVEMRVESELRRDRRRAAGLATVLRLLKAADETHEQQILSNVTVHDEQLAGVLHHRPSGLARLEDLDERSLLTLIETADPQVTVLALAGASGELVDRVLKQFPPGEAQRLRRALSTMGPTRLDDLEEAQSRLLESARQLEAAGRVRRLPSAQWNAAA